MDNGSHDPGYITERYVAERELGAQPAGRFCVAVDGERGGRVTVFRPRLDSVSTRSFVRRLQSEVERCAGLTGTAYCTIREVGVADDGAPFVVVDRPQGTALATTLRSQGRLSIDRALSVAIQVCDLVRRAHAAGLHPVPIGPDTIIADELPGGRMRISIVDLGLYRDAYEGAVTLPPRGGQLLAPQVIAGLAPDPTDDVYAVAALVHLLVFGAAPPEMSPHGPADGSGWPALPEDGRGLDRRLEACLHTVLLKGLAADRESRFGKIEALQRALTGLRQLMSLAAPAFELLAATRGRLGRRTDPLDLGVQRPGLQRAAEARARIREVVSSAVGRGAHLSGMDLAPAAGPPQLKVVENQLFGVSG